VASTLSAGNRGIGLEFVRQLLGAVNASSLRAGTPRARPIESPERAVSGHLKILPLDVAEPRSSPSLCAKSTCSSCALCTDQQRRRVTSSETFSRIDPALGQAFATNAQGPFLLAQALAPRLTDAAKVVAISSGLGSIERATRFGTPSYNISKAALNMAMRMLGHALADREIAVLALSPGWVRTDMGGAGAELAVEQSVSHMLAVIDALVFDVAKIGWFLDHNGERVPW
jgi:NAD(P)-dependent dehydrogenase (short-subunit alcohol dehydrogenase family)